MGTSMQVISMYTQTRVSSTESTPSICVCVCVPIYTLRRGCLGLCRVFVIVVRVVHSSVFCIFARQAAPTTNQTTKPASLRRDVQQFGWLFDGPVSLLVARVLIASNWIKYLHILYVRCVLLYSTQPSRDHRLFAVTAPCC